MDMMRTRLPVRRGGILLLALLLSCAEGSVTETPLDVADIGIAGARASLTVGESLQLQATPRSASGRNLTARPVNWSSSNGSVATVNGNGLVQAVGAGNVTITAASGPASSAVSIQVIAPPQLQVSQTNIAFTGTVGGANPAPATFTVTNSASAAVISGVTVTASSTGSWLSAVPEPAGSNSTPLTVRVSAQVAGLSAGQHTGTISVAAPGVPNSPRVINVTLTLTAQQFMLTVAGTGNGSGVVSGNGINCVITAGVTSGTCNVALSGGTTAVLTPTPNTGTAFAGWTGCSSVGGSNCSVAMTQNRTVTASFTLAQATPLVRTLPASSVGPGSAVLNGAASTTTDTLAGYSVWFEIGTSPTLATFSSAAPYTLLPGDPVCPGVSVECEWESRWDLRGSTTYYFRIAASNQAGTARGSILSFTTAPPQAPTVSTDSASLVTSTTFRTHGTSIPNGADHEFWFEVSSSPDMSNPVTSTVLSNTAEQGARIFFAGWSGATPNTVYYYRAVARNSAGTRFGATLNVRTAASAFELNDTASGLMPAGSGSAPLRSAPPVAPARRRN
jgi:hypothetical protein